MASEYQHIAGTDAVLRYVVEPPSRMLYHYGMPAKMYDGCFHPGCERPHMAKGHCRLHYERIKFTGDPEPNQLALLRDKSRSLDDCFMVMFGRSKRTAGGCLVWAGSKNVDRYGRMVRGGKTFFAHRLSYERFVGPTPSDMEICHTCDNPSCVNPEHLFLGTTRDNALDREAKGRSANHLKRIAFRFRDPNGRIVRGVGLSGFCRERGLLQPKMSQVLNGSRQSHKGWTRHGR
jgi:hypothetical protein